MLNMDFSQAVVINTNAQAWVDSPMPGVLRKRLARQEAERGHATSIVKYEAGATFSQHDHPLGEEILVLHGVFSDHSGDYGAGTYFRNPEGFTHAPFSANGCVILVKLHQFCAGDTARVCIDTHTGHWRAGNGNLQVMTLHNYEAESVALVKWPAGERFVLHQHVGGEEIFVLEGELIDEHGRYPAGTWMRSPHMSKHNPYVEKDTLIWVKTGHLLPRNLGANAGPGAQAACVD